MGHGCLRTRSIEDSGNLGFRGAGTGYFWLGIFSRGCCGSNPYTVAVKFPGPYSTAVA